MKEFITISLLLFFIQCSAIEDTAEPFNEEVKTLKETKSWVCLNCGKYKYQAKKPARFGCTSRWSAQGWHNWVEISGPFQ